MTTQENIKQDGMKIVEDILVRSMFAKSEMCKEHPMSDNPAMMFFMVQSDETNPAHDMCLEHQQESGLSKPYHTAMVPLVHKDEVIDCIEDIVQSLPIAKFDYVCVAVEAYGRKTEGLSADEINIENGELEREFRENPFTDVQETIVVTVMDYDYNFLLNGVVTYSYDDFGCPSYGEPMFHSEEMQADTDYGRVADTLKALCRYIQTTIMASNFRDLLNEARKEQ